ncbi:MAG: DUF362 domain-containing protein, partial [Verrucomicrobiae bacterium]|nr:DUF362 domain-containing protein [Verrucomicrobiae bacterium]
MGRDIEAGRVNVRRVMVVQQSPRYELAEVRESVRRALAGLELSLSDWIRPGERVLLKPNFIRQSHTERPDEWEQIITHGAVIAAVAEEVAAALQGRGTITVADGPQTDSDFDAICARTGVRELAVRLADRYPDLKFEILDLRREWWRTVNGVVVERRRLPEDPRGYTLVDLGERSFFHGKTGRFYGADYDTGFTQRHHSEGRHEYLISRTALDADVFISLPKLKTHKKVGVTLNLKGLVGINGDKNYLPHFCIGTPAEGGDEFPSSDAKARVQSRLIAAFKAVALRTGRATEWWAPWARRLGARVFGSTSKVVRSGNWWGNDTTWRMTLDLNRILLEYDGTGQLRQKPLRYLSIVDGIVAGEGDGPMEADAKPCGVLVAGLHPVPVDFVATQIMGFDWRKIALIRESFRLVDFGPQDVEWCGDRPQFRFRPHFGWVGHVEL